jgi:cysteine desulfurase / selenocysteine lyase
LKELEEIRSQFPILNSEVNGHRLVYFDNAATTQKPLQVINAMSDFYLSANANIHRGVHTLSRRATDMYEDARKTVAAHFGINNPQQVIFTAGTTDSINLVAQGLAKGYLRKGDEILVSTYEHHSNILPWQMWAEENGGKVVEIPITPAQSIEYDVLSSLITERTKLIAIAHVSNTLGVVTDIKRIASLAKSRGIAVLVDGAQSAPHMAVNVAGLDVDFFTCSAHKIYGPMGTGMLYLSEKWLKDLSLSRTGGGTIKTVTFKKTEYAEGALRLEPGTPNVAGAIGFAEALRFVQGIGMKNIHDYEDELLQYAQSKLKSIDEVEMYGQEKDKAAVISFNVKGQHPFDVGTLLDKYGIAVRTGHHCTQPLMECLGVNGTVRISFAVYNTTAEIDYFIDKLKKVISLLKG